ncbi:hypothetical protein BJ166DRAFT_532433 [Pestalotiopsis sp. NC0098]|nr:hypothetical protein BJ166DRAFT_532433 [Pestalotiopsis sp. NC0098]
MTAAYLLSSTYLQSFQTCLTLIMAVTSNALYMAADNSRIGLALAASILSIVAFLLLLQLYTHLKKASKAISLALQLLNIPIARQPYYH